jgi:DNA methylase
VTTSSFQSDFARWTADRNVPSLGTNDGATPLAFQKWHHFKEAFAPELIAAAVRASAREVQTCIDPFGGSGTTALACQMLGINSTTVEVNPFLADAIEAKLARYDSDKIVKELADVRRRVRRRSVDPQEYFNDVPKTFLEPGVKGRWLYNSSIAERLASILTVIDAVEDIQIRRLFRVIVGGILIDVSNATVSGKGRRYRQSWKDIPADPERVENLFASRAEIAILDIQAFSRRPQTVSNVIQADARKLQLEARYDLSVFSPPYPNSFDYTDVYNLELWMLGYLTRSEDNRALRHATLRSHVQVFREYPPGPTGSATLNSVIEQLQEVRKSLWDKWIPSMIGAYFSDLIVVLNRIISSLLDDGQCWMVVGDSRYAGITVPVAHILSELSEHQGWTIERCEPIRHMKSSAQQGWRPDLAETLIVLRHAPRSDISNNGPHHVGLVCELRKDLKALAEANRHQRRMVTSSLAAFSATSSKAKTSVCDLRISKQQRADVRLPRSIL